MRVESGVLGLDTLLHGGFLPGRNILLSGPCGSGKTTFAMQFAYFGAMSYGDPSLYVSLEERKEKIYQDMSQFGFDLEGAEKTGKFFFLGGPVAGIRGYMDKVDADITHILRELKEVIEKHNIKRVVIDSVNLLTMLLKNDDEKRKALAALCNLLSSLGCTTILTSETKEGSYELSRYGIEEFVVDGVVVLYLIMQGSQFVPGITVRKMRGSEHDKKVRVFTITNKGVIVHPDETLFSDTE